MTRSKLPRCRPDGPGQRPWATGPARPGRCTQRPRPAPASGRPARARLAALLLAALSLVALSLPGALPAAATLDRALWAEILRDYTVETSDTAGTRVDYRGLQREPRWRALVASVEASHPAALRTREERMAFWIDAYNILAIDMVVRHYPVRSIRDIGSFFSPVWKRSAARIDGEDVTLDQIEHRILRPMGDPRMHGAIVCASTSCPSLMRTPFAPADLDARLDAAVRRWLASPRKGLRLDRSRSVARISRIFQWFAGDFDAVGGVLAFVTRHAPPAERAWLEAHGPQVTLEYFDYDWSLNEWRR